MISAAFAATLATAATAIKLEEVYTYNRGPDYYSTGYGEFQVENTNDNFRTNYQDFSLDHNRIADTLDVNHQGGGVLDINGDDLTYSAFGLTASKAGDEYNLSYDTDFESTTPGGDGKIPGGDWHGIGGGYGVDRIFWTTGSWNWRHYGEGTDPTGTLIFQEDGKVNYNGTADPGSSWYVDDEGFMIHEWRANDVPHKMYNDVEAGTMTLVDPVRDPATFMDRA